MSSIESEPQPSRPKSLDDPRYRRLLAVTRTMAEKGYDAVSMRAVAREAQMSLTTIYQFVGSKDELIADAHAGGMRRFSDEVVRQPPVDESAQARVTAVMDQIAAGLEQDEARTRTLMRAMYSGEASVSAGKDSAADSFRAVLWAALGDERPPRSEQIVDTLGLTLHGALLAWLSGRYDGAQVRQLLGDAVALVFEGANGAADVTSSG